jgi:predicted nucleotidyltransferase
MKNPYRIIQRMVSLIIRDYHPEKIILFGSYARGDAGPDSDADLLIVMNAGKNRRLRKIEILSRLAGIGLPKDIVIVTPEELEKYADKIGTIVYPAVREGRILYEKAS